MSCLDVLSGLIGDRFITISGVALQALEDVLIAGRLGQDSKRPRRRHGSEERRGSDHDRVRCDMVFVGDHHAGDLCHDADAATA